MKRLCPIALALVLAGTVDTPLRAQSPQQLFQQALSKERADGNIEEAIRLYERALAAAGTDRALASRALLQIGRCHEKLGEAAARGTYERLLRDFADQPEAAAEARTRLAALVRAAAPGPRPAMTVRHLPDVGFTRDLQALSPDGTQAIVGDYDKGQNLAIFDFATRTSRLLTSLDWSHSWTYDALWSPDGRQIAYLQAGFSNDAVAELRVIGLTGEPRTIFRNDAAPGGHVRPAAWLPDSSALLAVLERADRTTAIGIVSVADGTFTPLRSFSWALGRSDLPALSADGRFAAFVERSGAGPGDVHVLSLDGRQAFRVTDHPADDREPVWSPDGKHLAFISNRFGADALWAVAVDNGRPRGEPFKIKDGMHGAELLEWSPRGIAATQLLQSWDVYTMPVDRRTGRATGEPAALPYPRTGQNVSPAWSPDGKSLAFISSSASELGRRYLVVLPQGGKPREFLIPTTNYAFPQAPYDLRWFGNGRGLGFSGTDARGEPVAFRLTLDNGEWRTFPVPVKSWTRAEWNEDGTAFYYARQNFAEPEGGVYERSVDGGRERRIYAMPEWAGAMRSHEFSPDRRRLAFLQNGSDRIDIVVVEMASGESRTVMSVTSSTGARLQLAGWSPDGRIVAQRTAGGRAPAENLVVPVDGGVPEPLPIAISRSGTPGAVGSQPLVKWSPDGSALAFVTTGRAGGAFIIEHPLADLPSGAASATRR